jgi:hypothetical protein
MKKLAALAILTIGVSALALFGGQRRLGGGGGFFGADGSQDGPEPRDIDRSGFVYARIRYHMLPFRMREVPWHHDYPEGDETFPDSLQRLTGTYTTRQSYQIVDIDSKDLFQYPFAYLCEPGYLDLQPADVENFREYLDRGGFVMVDDFRGFNDLDNLITQLKKVYPDRDIARLDVAHPIFHSFFDMATLDMRPPYGTEPVQFLGLSDPKGRLQMIIDYNNDLSEFWQWLDEGQAPLAESANSVRLGVNYALYAMTH